MDPTVLYDRLAEMESRLARVEQQDRFQALAIHADTLYTIQEVADRLRCGLSTAYALARDGKLRARSVGPGGKGYRVLGSDLLLFLRGDEGDWPDSHPNTAPEPGPAS